MPAGELKWGQRPVAEVAELELAGVAELELELTWLTKGSA